MITCYCCDKPLSEQERQHWMPFDLCTKCEQEAEEVCQQRAHLHAVLPIYWIMKPVEQDGIRQLIEEVGA